MNRYGILAFSLLSYAVGMLGLTYFLLFVGGWEFLPVNVNGGHVASPLRAIAVNLALVALFAVQHSVMARPWFKRRLYRVLPAAAERSLYVLLSGAALLVLCAIWQQMGGALWNVQQQPARLLLQGVYAAGWTLAIASSFAIDHFELFGVSQALRNLRGDGELRPAFLERWFYRVVRHPLQTGVLIGLWATPTMTVAHLLLSVSLTVYILFALQLEERDLAVELGAPYEDYRRRVPMLVPRVQRPAPTPSVQA
ncbi:MAG: isoprenylcysteine carboxylmethyltransferase family protein [Planctomycetales bacterium]|nr:isoprenylcysteine carboxylmethyltransferase family protein [Planctomycetales bacterium]